MCHGRGEPLPRGGAPRRGRPGSGKEGKGAVRGLVGSSISEGGKVSNGKKRSSAENRNFIFEVLGGMKGIIWKGREMRDRTSIDPEGEGRSNEKRQPSMVQEGRNLQGTRKSARSERRRVARELVFCSTP